MWWNKNQNPDGKILSTGGGGNGRQELGVLEAGGGGTGGRRWG